MHINNVLTKIEINIEIQNIIHKLLNFLGIVSLLSMWGQAKVLACADPGGEDRGRQRNSRDICIGFLSLNALAHTPIMTTNVIRVSFSFLIIYIRYSSVISKTGLTSIAKFKTAIKNHTL